MLDARGQLLLGCGLGVTAGGLILALPAALLVGVLMLIGLLQEVLRLRARLGPAVAPWGLQARLGPPRGEASTAGLAVRSQRVDQQLSLEVELTLRGDVDGLTLFITGFEATSGLDVEPARRVAVVRRGPATSVSVLVSARTAAVHRIFGLRGQIVDEMGVLAAEVFVPCPHEVAVLPRSLPLDMRRLPETRRRVARAAAGQMPDRVQGHGDELRELRDHQPGDPFKHIAWKASARRGRLMSRSFEHERARALYVVLDTGATMRDGRLGDGPLDQAQDLVHSLAEAATRLNLPFGLSAVDGEVIVRQPVLEGLRAVRETDRALLDMRRTVAEGLTPLPDADLLEIVARYLRSVERVDLPSGDAGGEAYVRFRQRTVMAALARLPERERLPALRGPEPSPRADLSILRRFCRAMDLALPYRGALDPERRLQGLVAGVSSALSARKGPFVIVIVSDFRGLRPAASQLWQACARARRSGHRVVVLAVREGGDGDLIDAVENADDVDTARGLAKADRAAREQLLHELNEGCRRAGAIFLPDPTPKRLLSLWATMGQ